MERKYYDIDERTARVAHEMMSFSDYKDGSYTEEYKGYCDKCYDIAEETIKQKPDEAGRIVRLAETYAKKLAENMNKHSRIGTMCPSVMISGAGNFPQRKKEKQIAAEDRNHQEWLEINGIIHKIERIREAQEVIRSDDDNAIEKLYNKLESLKELQETMKKVNAYYRKNKTLDGCPDLTEKQIRDMKNSMVNGGFRYEDKPFMSYALTNNNQNIHSVEARIKRLEREKERASERAAQSNEESEKENVFEIKGEKIFEVVENAEIMRLQIFFDGKPEPEVRAVLKSHAFKWAPSYGAWQRMLNNNARFALETIKEELQEMQH